MSTFKVRTKDSDDAGMAAVLGKLFSIATAPVLAVFMASVAGWLVSCVFPGTFRDALDLIGLAKFELWQVFAVTMAARCALFGS